MKQVYKYTVEESTQQFYMPASAKVLCVMMQGDDICLWAEVDPMAMSEHRIFYITGTGLDLKNDNDIYHGSVMDGGFVWHLYEIPADRVD